MLSKIISGGQTGVDRAALDAALSLGIAHGGTCPKGRKAEDGSIPDKYVLTENNSTSYRKRTEQNIRNSDATLVLNRGEISSGTKLTIALAKFLEKPFLIITPDLVNKKRFLDFLLQFNVSVLNIAGPRESKMYGIYKESKDFLEGALIDANVISI